MDHQPRSGLRPKKRVRDRLIQRAARHPEWVLGFADEAWWRRLAPPSLHTWTEEPLRLIEQTVARDDPDPKALACYGLLRTDTHRLWLRFVDGRLVSAVTAQFLGWCCERLEHDGKTALVLV